MNTKQSRRKALRTLAAGGALAAAPMVLQAQPRLSGRALRIAGHLGHLDDYDQALIENVARSFLGLSPHDLPTRPRD